MGLLGCVTGVSGSGKSTLVYDILYKRLAQAVAQGRDRPGEHDEVTGIEHIDKVVNIDQSPIGRTPRSNPATYTGAFTPIRELFATLPEARIRGYKPGRFSFNVKGGRCESCQGEGYIQIEMQFLPDVTVPCEVCQGRRYNREALEVTLRDQSIADVLAMTVETALDFFWNYSRIRSKLETLRDVGLGYIRLGQPAHDPCPAAKPSGSSWQPSYPAAPPAARCTSWTNLPPASLLKTAPPCSASCTGWLTRGTPYCSSNTTSTSSKTPTGSSTWDPAPVTWAATYWRAARRRRWPR